MEFIYYSPSETFVLTADQFVRDIGPLEQQRQEIYCDGHSSLSSITAVQI